MESLYRPLLQTVPTAPNQSRLPAAEVQLSGAAATLASLSHSAGPNPSGLKFDIASRTFTTASTAHSAPHAAASSSSSSSSPRGAHTHMTTERERYRESDRHAQLPETRRPDHEPDGGLGIGVGADGHDDRHGTVTEPHRAVQCRLRMRTPPCSLANCVVSSPLTFASLSLRAECVCFGVAFVCDGWPERTPTSRRRDPTGMASAQLTLTGPSRHCSLSLQFPSPISHEPNRTAPHCAVCVCVSVSVCGCVNTYTRSPIRHTLAKTALCARAPYLHGPVLALLLRTPLT